MITQKSGNVHSEKTWHLYLVVLLLAGAIYLGCIISPPSLMDDVDAVHGQISRTMLTSGDWVTMRLDGRYGARIYSNATVLLRPKTGLEDMVAELDPGSPRGGHHLNSGATLTADHGHFRLLLEEASR